MIGRPPRNSVQRIGFELYGGAAMRWFALGLASLAALACATPRPVLYPNAALERVGREQAQRDIDACLALAERDVGHGGNRSGERVAARTATGAATGAAVGAAASRSAARGAAGGAAGAATHGILSSLLHPRRNQPDPVFRNYVDRCLHERGYDVIGWRAK